MLVAGPSSAVCGSDGAVVTRLALALVLMLVLMFALLLRVRGVK